MNYGKRKLPSVSADDVGSSTEPLTDDTVKRKFRNLNEKKRRDQFNMLINELSAIVCSAESRRVDKTTVLEQAIQFLQQHQASETTQNENISYSWKPSFLSLDEFSYLMLEAMDCVTLGLDEIGLIKYVSDNAHHKLGVSQDSLYIGDEFHKYLADSTVLDTLITSAKHQSNRLTRAEVLLVNDPENEDKKYQIAELLCVPEGDINNDQKTSFRSNLSMNIDTYNCIVQLKQPVLSKEFQGPPEMTFKGKYSLEWKVLHIENKSSAVLGYQPIEILGTSGYDLYHPQDIERIAACHKKMVRSGVCKTGLYRMLTKSQGWVWLQSDFYMCFNQWSGKPEHVEAIHKVPRPEEIQAFKKSGFAQETISPPSTIKRSRPSGGLSAPTLPQNVQRHQHQNTPKKDMFTSHLADIGINKNREIKFGRLPQELYLDQPTKSLQAEPILLSPMYLTPIQKKLHQQLQTKYKDLKSSLDRQQEELNDLLRQLNLVATMRPTVPVSTPQQVNATLSNNMHSPQQTPQKTQHQQNIGNMASPQSQNSHNSSTNHNLYETQQQQQRQQQQQQRQQIQKQQQQHLSQNMSKSQGMHSANYSNLMSDANNRNMLTGGNGWPNDTIPHQKIVPGGINDPHNHDCVQQ